MIIPRAPEGGGPSARSHAAFVRTTRRSASAWAARVRGLGRGLGPLVPRARCARPRLHSVARFAGSRAEWDRFHTLGSLALATG